MKTIAIMVRVSEKNAKQIDQLIGTLGLSRAEVIRYIIQRHLDDRTAWQGSK